MPIIDLRPTADPVGGGGGGGATLADVANAWKVVFITLSIADISNGFVTLPETPQSPVKTKLEIIEGLPSDYGVDYNVVGAQINFLAPLLGTPGQELEPGDRLRITYFSI
jgi:hypothetical protein